MRMFVALQPSVEAIEHLDEFLEPRRTADGPGMPRWSLAEQVHLTLAFMAEVAEYQIDELIERLHTAAERRLRFPASIAGGGAFPNAFEARVLWAGLRCGEAGLAGEVSGEGELERLAIGAKSAATKAGVEIDGQRFRPHLTVARFPRPVEATKWLRILDTYVGPEWLVEEMALVASYLGESMARRPRHEVVARFPLGT